MSQLMSIELGDTAHEPMRYQLRLADRLWLAAYDRQRGALLVDRPGLSLACAGALLCELLRDGVIAVTERVLPRTAPGATTEDPVLCPVILDELWADQHSDLRAWISRLGDAAEARVRSRMMIRRVLTEIDVPHSRLRGGGSTTRYEPMRWSEASEPERTVAGWLLSPGSIVGGQGVITIPQYVDDVVLAVFADVLGFLPSMDIGDISRRQARGIVGGWRERLPRVFASIVDEVDAAVAQRAQLPR